MVEAGRDRLFQETLPQPDAQLLGGDPRHVARLFGCGAFEEACHLRDPGLGSARLAHGAISLVDLAQREPRGLARRCPRSQQVGSRVAEVRMAQVRLAQDALIGPRG